MRGICSVLILGAVLVGCRDYASPTAAIQGSVTSDPSQPPYETIDLGTLGGQNSDATDLNNAGQVVGSSQTADGVTHAFLWHNGVMVDLDPDGQGQFCCGPGPRLNNAGHVMWNVSSTGVSHAVLWRDGVITDLGSFGPHGATATAFNNRDQVVGLSNQHAFLWDRGTMRDLGYLGLSGGGAGLINNRGQIVGGIVNRQRLPRAVLFEDGRIVDLGSLPGADGSPDQETGAVAINERGQILGRSAQLAVNERWRPFIWQRGAMLPASATFQADESMLPVAINERGVVLARRGVKAVILEDGLIWELDSPGLTRPVALNQRGDVVGFSFLGPNSLVAHAFLWRRTAPVAAVLP